jgi:hypothetical protein
MSGGFRVSPDVLSQKAQAVDSISSGVQECVAASDEVGVGGLVYGVLFDPTMLPALSQAKDDLAETIGTIAKATGQVAAGLRKNAETYTSVEQFLAEQLDKMRQGG